MSYKSITWVSLQQALFSALSTSTFTVIGSPLKSPAVILKIQNTTDADILVSTNASSPDGNDLIPAGSFTTYDFCANKTQYESVLALDAGTTFYIKALSVPSKGRVAITAFTVTVGV